MDNANALMDITIKIIFKNVNLVINYVQNVADLLIRIVKNVLF